MYLFLLFSIPLTFLIINTIFNNSEIKLRSIILPFVYGMVLSIPFYLIYWAFFSSFFNNWTFPNIYFFYYFNKEGISTLYMVILIALVYTFIYKETKRSRLREFTAYISGMMFTLSVHDVLTAEEWYGALEYFYIPLLRICLILTIAVLLNKYLFTIDWKKYLWLVGAIFVPFVTISVLYFYSMNIIFPALILTIVLLTASVFFYFTESRQ